MQGERGGERSEATHVQVIGPSRRQYACTTCAHQEFAAQRDSHRKFVSVAIALTAFVVLMLCVLSALVSSLLGGVGGSSR